MHSALRRRISRFLPPLLIVPLMAGLLAAPTSAEQSCMDEGATLRVGASAFCGPVAVGDQVGDGPRVAQVRHPALCGHLTCPEWPLRLTGGGDGTTLRVALSAVLRDHDGVRPWADFNASAPEMVFGLQVLDADEKVLVEGTEKVLVEGTTAEAGGTFTAYAVEVLLAAPAQGKYTVRVVPESVFDMDFRLRAKLESASPKHGSTGPAVLSPNLRTIPPFEFNFFSPTASYGPGVPVPAPRASCMAEEIEEAVDAGEDRPSLCLRYSMGFENSGEGMFWLSVFCPACQHYYEIVALVGNHFCEQEPFKSQFRCRMGGVVGEKSTESPRDWPLTQVRYFKNGTCCEVEKLGSAGSGRLHPAHGHLHYQNAYSYELFRVDDANWVPSDGRPKQLNEKGPGRKLGVFPGNEMLSDWDRFYQATRDLCPPRGEGRDDCGSGMGNSPLLGLGEPKLNAGWGDVYEWNRGGNYVDFPADERGTPRAGHYLLRGTSDPEGLIIETDERDNSSYALIRVTSEGEVHLIERGYGKDPWEPHRVVLTAAPG